MTDQLVVYLNSLVQADRLAIHDLVEHRVSANQALEDHPTCVLYGGEKDVRAFVGMLGVINGFLRSISEITMRNGPIGGVYDDEGQLVEFKRV